MDQRLQQFLMAENISQSQFADKLGVARASVSHILSGRNKPGFDFIENLSRAYPTVNLEWVITGKGKMYKEMQKSAIEKAPTSSTAPAPAASPSLAPAFAPEAEPAPEPVPVSAPIPAPANDIQPSTRTIVKIIAFYSDGTYQELK